MINNFKWHLLLIQNFRKITFLIKNKVFDILNSIQLFLLLLIEYFIYKD